MLTKDKQDMIYDMIVSDMAKFSDHVVVTSLKDVLFDLQHIQVCDTLEEEEELEDAICTLLRYYGTPGVDFIA